MKQNETVPNLAWMRKLSLFILCLIPFHAPITIWLSSFGLNYDILRLWKEFLLACLVGGLILSLILTKKVRELILNDTLLKLIIAFCLLALIGALSSLLLGETSPRAIAFGFIVNTRMLLFAVVIFVLASFGKVSNLINWLIIPAIIVVGFGLLQATVLPADFLKHLGYGPETIAPFQAVDNNPDFPRIQSTLRGPNPLGAYLIPIIMLLITGLVRYRNYRKYLLSALLAAGLVMVGTYSRSAALGVALALSLYLAWNLKIKTKLVISLIGLVIIVGATGVYIGRDNDIVQNVIFHSSEKSPSTLSSNEQRANALKQGMLDIYRQPLGGGIGTAGPASFQNEKITRISENYYIQIGQEMGIVGLVLYLSITYLIIKRLWISRSNKTVSAVLAAFLGLTLVNLLSHAWTDDTLAYVFGALIGYSLSLYKQSTKSEKIGYNNINR